MRRAIFFFLSLPVALMAGVLLSDDAHLWHFWLCELPVALLAFCAWVWAYVELCARH